MSWRDEKPGQGDMFENLDLPAVKPITWREKVNGEWRDKTTQEAFEEFHAKNPHVYVALVRLTRVAVRNGRKVVGMQSCVERLRWDYFTQTTHHEDEFKINNNFASRYARLIMANEPDLAGIYKTRKLKAV
jgi:hypothetical protein